ncbi:filamentous hemagglutinin [Klebsiella pneumoniae]|uniref:Filamentous hemagglutinin n=1 Tax=Klebsiella pneumoniae TaxID=573 RepID=A0A378FPU8_KLEPN|nr:filamentous hemagglutinin [Klebsiella pneumoniae]
MFKFKASYVALAAVLTSSVVYADPTSYTHSSGATVIDIEKPNAAGVSHNLYATSTSAPMAPSSITAAMMSATAHWQYRPQQ